MIVHWISDESSSFGCRYLGHRDEQSIDRSRRIFLTDWWCCGGWVHHSEARASYVRAAAGLAAEIGPGSRPADQFTDSLRRRLAIYCSCCCCCCCGCHGGVTERRGKTVPELTKFVRWWDASGSCLQTSWQFTSLPEVCESFDEWEEKDVENKKDISAVFEAKVWEPFPIEVHNGTAD